MNKHDATIYLKGIKDFYGLDKDSEEAIDMAIEALSADARWIPVSERLPEGYDQYLCYCEGGECYVFWLDNEPWAEETVEKEGILAWMPLPEPYKGGDTE